MKEQGLQRDGDVFPENVSISAVARFERDGNDAGPKLSSTDDPIRLEMRKSVSRSKWNERAVLVLAVELHRRFHKKENLTEDELKTINMKTITLNFCRKQITQRLDLLRRDFERAEQGILEASKTKAETDGRRKNRLESVSSVFISAWIERNLMHI